MNLHRTLLAVPTALLALATLSACGDDGDTASARTAGDEPSSQSPTGTPTDADPAEPAEPADPGSPEQVEALRACLEDIGLPVADTPNPERPEHLLSLGPVASGPDRKLEGQVYVFESAARAEEERPNVTFFDDDTDFDSLVGNVLVVYYPAPSAAGGLEAGIDDCLAP